MSADKLARLHRRMRACRLCPEMRGPPVHGPAVTTKVMLIGQAPGPHEGRLGRPFAHTAGKTLFKWLGSASGLAEEELRQRIYIAATARCFPGKAKGGHGDREPSPGEIRNCRRFLEAEVAILRPQLILAVGRVAIAEVLGPEHFRKSTPLGDVIGRLFTVRFHDVEADVIALPHPSGVSRWPHTEPGKSKLKQALRLIAEHGL